MITIDIPMPKSCSECPIQGETYHGCPFLADVPAWQKDIADNCRDKRSEHCPMKEHEAEVFDEGLLIQQYMQPIKLTQGEMELFNSINNKTKDKNVTSAIFISLALWLSDKMNDKKNGGK